MSIRINKQTVSEHRILEQNEPDRGMCSECGKCRIVTESQERNKWRERKRDDGLCRSCRSAKEPQIKGSLSLHRKSAPAAMPDVREMDTRSERRRG